MKHVISIYLLYSFAHKNRGQADNFICKNKYKNNITFLATVSENAGGAGGYRKLR
jgi:hypothetical protein